MVANHPCWHTDVPSAVASNCVIGFLGSDPNSGQDFRASQQGLWGSDRNFAVARSGAPAGRAEGSANLGSDPHNPDPNNPRSNLSCLHTLTASAVSSKCVAAVERYVSVFISGPTLSAPPLSRPAGRKRGASFGHVYELRKYTRTGMLKSQRNFRICNLSSDLDLDLAPHAVMRRRVTQCARRADESGCLLFWALFFGPAKKNTSPAEAKPSLPALANAKSD